MEVRQARRSLGPAVALALLGACVTSREHRGVTPPPAVSTQAVEVLEARAGGVLAGLVVRFEEDQADSRGFWSVRNTSHQELGLVDDLGRAWRFHPFAAEPEWVGSGTVAEGVALILGAEGPVHLAPASDGPDLAQNAL